MLTSILVNALLALTAAAAIASHCRNSPARVVFRYFTAQSNALCAAAAALVALCRLGGGLPLGAALLKYVATAAVTVTMLTVLFFLGPTMGYRILLTGADLWLHLLCPVLAIVSFRAWDRPEMPPAAMLLGVMPVLLYGVLYLRRAVLSSPEKGWEDFYGFNRGGHWRLSFVLMTLAAALTSWLLWM